MTDGKRPRRRRGRRGGGQRQPEADQQQPGTQDGAPKPDGRRDSRGGKPGDGAAPAGSSVRRSPHAAAPPGNRQRRDTRGTPRPDEPRPARREQRGSRSDQNRPRPQQRETLEMPPPDPESVELGAAFKEAHQALRDAIRALEKRKAEHDDEPAWLVEQAEAAEQRFAEAADRWTDHLEKSGRRGVARVR